jgi:hypothetical protein
MGTKILQVTFCDGIRMYGQYSTVVDVADTDIARELSGPGAHPLSSRRFDDEVFSSADEEIVQCEVLHYGNVSEFTAWTSTAKRRGELGKITGVTHGERYSGDVAAIASEMDLKLQADSAPEKRRDSRLRAFLQRLI